jgi:hypothetical protein
MDEEGIDEACFYLTGACSCQVKVQNPGWDLPMNVKWNERLIAADSTSAPPEGPLDSQASESETAEPEAEEVRFTPLFRPPTADINLTYIIVGLLLIGGVVLLLSNRKAKAK